MTGNEDAPMDRGPDSGPDSGPDTGLDSGPDREQGDGLDREQGDGLDREQDHTEVLWALDTADRLRGAMRSSEMRPAFRERLRAEVVAARAEVIAARAAETSVPTLPAAPPAPRTGTVRRLVRPWPIAWVGAAAAVVVVAVIVGVLARPERNPPAPVSVAALTDVAGTLSADPTQPLRLRFTRPLDHEATKAALRLVPAVDTGVTWQGDTLTVSPVHGFAPNVPYVVTIQRDIARTATGARLANDLRVAFGTAPVPSAGHAPAGAVPLARTQLAAAEDGSEAVFTRTGAVLLTAARPSRVTDQHSGLVRLENGTAFKISGSTAAICVSRTGDSIAYLTAGGQGDEVVFANGVGTPQRHLPVVPDRGSPLAWTGDAEISYVSGGRLRAIDRTGKVRVLSNTPVDAAQDSVVISPGSRYVYLRRPADASGQLVDLLTGAEHQLRGIAGDPAFSADGATAVWIDASGDKPRLATAASGGGPVLAAPLPVQPGDRLSNVAVSPDASRVVYSVTHSDGRAELRLAGLPSGNTLAVSTDGAGESPNWSSTGSLFTVLSHGAGGARIDAITVPDSVADVEAAYEAAAATFANAQISGDPDAQHAMTASGVALPAVPQVTRSAVLWVRVAPDGTATARVRLTIDPRPDSPDVTQAEETLTLARRRGNAPPVVRAVDAEPFGPVPAGPHVVQLDTDATPGAVLVTFDSDLDPASVASAITLATPDNSPIDSNTTYDPANRTVTVRPTSPAAAKAVVVRVGTGLRDVSHTGLAADVRIPATLGG